MECDAVLDISPPASDNLKNMKPTKKTRSQYPKGLSHNISEEQDGASNTNSSDKIGMALPRSVSTSDTADCQYQIGRPVSEATSHCSCFEDSVSDTINRHFENTNETTYNFSHNVQTMNRQPSDVVKADEIGTILVKSLKTIQESNRQCFDILASTLTKNFDTIQKSNNQSLNIIRSTLIEGYKNAHRLCKIEQRDSDFEKIHDTKSTQKSSCVPETLTTPPSPSDQFPKTSVNPTNGGASSQTFPKVLDTHDKSMDAKVSRQCSSFNGKLQTATSSSHGFTDTKDVLNSDDISGSSQTFAKTLDINSKESDETVLTNDKPVDKYKYNSVTDDPTCKTSHAQAEKINTLETFVEKKCSADCVNPNGVEKKTLPNFDLFLANCIEGCSGEANEFKDTMTFSEKNRTSAISDLSLLCRENNEQVCNNPNDSTATDHTDIVNNDDNSIGHPIIINTSTSSSKSAANNTANTNRLLRMEELNLICDKRNLELYSYLLTKQLQASAKEDTTSSCDKLIETSIEPVKKSSKYLGNGWSTTSPAHPKPKNKTDPSCEEPIYSKKIPAELLPEPISIGTERTPPSQEETPQINATCATSVSQYYSQQYDTVLRRAPSKIDDRISDDFELNILLLKIAGELDDGDINKIKFLCTGNNGIPRGVLDKLKTPLDFFQHLKEKLMISRDNLLLLQAFLWQVDRRDLQELASEYARRVGNTLYFYSPKQEPEMGFEYVEFHVEGTLDNFQRDKIEGLRATVARLLFVKQEFIFLSGVEPSHSLMLTMMIHGSYVDKLKSAFLKNKDIFGRLGVDGISVHGEAFLDPLLAVRRASAPACEIADREVKELYKRSVRMETMAMENEVKMLESREEAEQAKENAKKSMEKEKYFRSVLTQALDELEVGIKNRRKH